MSSHRRSQLVASFGAALAASLLSSSALADRDYTIRKRVDQFGGVAVAANNIVTCAPSVACTAAQAAAGGGDQNNAFSGAYVDADGDDSTFASSMATLALPATADVTWAGLYWAGDSAAAAAVDGQVRLKVPGALSYEPLTAEVFDDIGVEGDYQAFVDVTAQVRAAGAGAYWVADVNATVGTTGIQGGWSLVVIYRDRDPAAPLRNVTVFDGARPYGDETLSLDFANFLTPLAGDVITELGMIAYDGDRGRPDSITLTSGALTTAIGDAISPTADVMNSTVSRGGAAAAGRLPAHANTLGYDADLVRLENRIANGATSANVTLATGGEDVYGGVVIFSTDIYLPNLEGTKTSTDLNGGTLRPGDLLAYTITVHNDGLDAAINARLTDQIPAGTSYVAGSLRVGGVAEDDEPSDAVGGYDSDADAIVVNLGATPGRVEIDETVTVSFRVKVDAAPAVARISNQAELSYAGETLGAGTTLTDVTDGDAETGGDNPTDDPIDDGDGDSDDDGLSDDEEADAGTDPLDADSDDDGVIDGEEPSWDQDSDGDGLVNALDPDSDNDGLLDGTELGVTTPNADTNVAAGAFIPDGDAGATTTDPLDADSDDGGVIDGAEDTDRDGVIDAGETDPTAGHGGDDASNPDGDGDGLSDDLEETLGTDPDDADSDDDGVIDGLEPNFSLDTDGDGLINALDPDSDDDGLLDGTELGVTAPNADTDVGAGHFVPDGDAGATTTSPLDPDTDHGGIPDGVEDGDHDGMIDAGEGDPNDPGDDGSGDSDGDGLSDDEEEDAGTDPADGDSDDDGVIDGDEPSWDQDSDGDGLINALDPDSDNDGLLDGTELGVTSPSADTNADAGNFVPDGDAGATTTDPLDADSDDGGVIDGAEDADLDGVIDPGETDPTAGHGADDDDNLDSDGDGLTDDLEETLGTDPNDADSDDDGVVDGAEPNFSLDSDGDGLINPLDPDSDDDGLFDGTELGISEPHADTDLGAGHFIPDGDAGATTTSPLDADTDDGGVDDGEEDSDHDGVVDPGERDPLDPSDDGSSDDDRDDDGIIDASDNCPDTANPDQADADGDLLGDACDPDRDGDGFLDGNGVQGGGCQAGGAGQGGTAALLALGLLGTVVGVRRRRRVRGIGAGAATVALTLVAMAGTSSAQEAVEPRNFMLERFALATDRQGLLSVEWAEALGDHAIDISLWGGYQDDPLVLYADTPDGREVVGDLLSSRAHLSLTASYSPTRWLAVGLEVPLIAFQDRPSTSDVTPGGLASISGGGLGNLRFAPKLTLLRQAKHGVGLALVPSIFIPTQSADDAYFGDRGWGIAPELAVSHRFGARVRLAANLGWKSRKKATVADLVVDDELAARIGVGLRLIEGTRPLDLDLATSLATAAKAPLDKFNTNHAEALAGLTYQVAQPVQVFGGGGVGLANGFGTPDWRVLAGVRLTAGGSDPVNDPDGDGLIGAADECPTVREDRDGWQDEDGCADPDNDGDGVLDVDDGAPLEPEDKDDFSDADGVPDPDNDGDGVLDGDDACPVEAGIAEAQGCPAKDSDGDGLFDHVDRCAAEAEDADQYEDTDGCPDPDNDSDGVLDGDDRCPLEPGPAGNQGCPDTDRDGDSVVDRLDNCPDEKGTEANQGCAKKQLVEITDGELQILQSVYFKLDKAIIEKRSYKLLDNVAAVLKVHGHLKIQVEGHTDSQGDDAYNKDLSQRRAEAVVAYLTKKGVAAERLTAKGFGEEVPVASNDTKAGRAQNRRVVFTILGGDGSVKTSEQGAGADTTER